MSLSIQPRSGRQRGVAAVEFALTATVLFLFLFGAMEVARLTFVWNSLSQATRAAARGAATTPFPAADGTAPARDAVLQRAIFVNSPTAAMPLTDNITYKNLLVDYLDASQQPVKAVPSCVIDNVVQCAADPTGNECVRFVRVRLCAAGSSSSSCTRVPYHTWFGLPKLATLNVNMPEFTAIAPLEAQALPGQCN